MKWLTGHQPNYLPYPGFFSKILRADVFVVVDHVQFRKKSDHMRNTIHGPNGPFMLSLKTSAPYQSSLCDVLLVDAKHVLQEHWESIHNCYSKYPYFSSLSPAIREVYAGDYQKMADLNEALIQCLLGLLQIEISVYKSSETMQDRNLKNNDMIIHLCKQLGCGGYISGMKAKDYILEEKFCANGLEHMFNDYKPIHYSTPRGPSVPNMCLLDPLFAIGPEKTVKLLKEHYASS